MTGKKNDLLSTEQAAETLGLDEAETAELVEAGDLRKVWHRAGNDSEAPLEAFIVGADVTKAAAADVKGLAAALKAGGKALPKALRRRAAKDAAELTAVTLEAAEDLLKQTQGELVEVIRDNWAAMHDGFAKGGEEKRASVAAALAEVVADLGPATRDYASITTLDAQVQARFPEIRKAVDAEQRDVLGWYAATHNTRTPLTDVRLPDPANRGQTLRFTLLDVAAALLDAVAKPGAFAVSEWCPPDDPQHEQMRDAPLPSEPWVEAAVAREHGRGCVICGGGSKADTLTRIDGRLALVHGECLRKPPTPQEQKRTARLASMHGSNGYPPPPHQAGTVFGTGDYVPAKKLNA